MKTQMTKQTEDRCRECGGELAFHSYKHVEKVGRYTITDASSMVWQCLACKTPQLTLDDLQGYQLNAAKTALCDGRHDGPVVRYARKALGLTQKELGLIIDYQHETISRWETDKEAAPGVAMSAVVGVLCRAMAEKTVGAGGPAKKKEAPRSPSAKRFRRSKA